MSIQPTPTPHIVISPVLHEKPPYGTGDVRIPQDIRHDLSVSDDTYLHAVAYHELTTMGAATEIFNPADPSVVVNDAFGQYVGDYEYWEAIILDVSTVDTDLPIDPSNPVVTELAGQGLPETEITCKSPQTYCFVRPFDPDSGVDAFYTDTIITVTMPAHDDDFTDWKVTSTLKLVKNA